MANLYQLDDIFVRVDYASRQSFNMLKSLLHKKQLRKLLTSTKSITACSERSHQLLLTVDLINYLSLVTKTNTNINTSNTNSSSNSYYSQNSTNSSDSGKSSSNNNSNSASNNYNNYNNHSNEQERTPYEQLCDSIIKGYTTTTANTTTNNSSSNSNSNSNRASPSSLPSTTTNISDTSSSKTTDESRIPYLLLFRTLLQEHPDITQLPGLTSTTLSLSASSASSSSFVDGATTTTASSTSMCVLFQSVVSSIFQMFAVENKCSVELRALGLSIIHQVSCSNNIQNF